MPGRFGGDRNSAQLFISSFRQGSFLHFIALKAMNYGIFTKVKPCVYVIDLQGNLEIIRLRNNIKLGEVFQAMVPAGSYFANRPSANEVYCLVGYTVTPGFDFEDFKLF